MKKPPRVATTKKKQYQDIYQDSRWKSISWLRRKNNPLCQVCIELDPPMAIRSNETHHRIPWEWGRDDQEQMALAYDYDNTMALCTPHHKKEDRRLARLSEDTRNNMLNRYFKANEDTAHH